MSPAQALTLTDNMGTTKCSQHHGNQTVLASIQNDPLSLLATHTSCFIPGLTHVTPTESGDSF